MTRILFFCVLAKGYITVEVLRDILHELDDKISSSDLDLMIDEIDADGSGTVDFEEFMEVSQDIATLCGSIVLTVRFILFIFRL